VVRRGDNKNTLADARERATAATEFGRTVVVTAGAGTGKTALLVERALNILMMPGARVPVTEVLALTFSKRAAGEMRVRIREALTKFVEWSLAADGPPAAAGHMGSIYCGIVARPGAGDGLAREEVRDRAVEALSSLERASISTMHSFAGHMLRHHPVEAGVDPHFREDDGLAFAEQFEVAWERFLETELGDGAQRADLWNAVLDDLSLVDLTGLAGTLCDEGVPLDRLSAGLADGSLFRLDREWLAGLAREASDVLSAHEDGASQNTGKLLRASVEFFGGLLAGRTPDDLAEFKEGLAASPGATKKWDAAAVAQVKKLGGIANRLVDVREKPLRGALELLLPFAREFRAEFVRSGEISFNALLVRARDLLRDHPRVRDDLKLRYRHILVDEFQDTDPVQYEIVFYLAERKGSSAPEWRGCELEPGKLFIVGDPKQSIYHFRGADIGAYHEVVEERLAGEATSLSLRTNFRSNGRLISTVNGIFASMINGERGVQPAYEALAVRPRGEARLSSQRVDFLLARPPGGGAFGEAGDAHEGEARALARWISTELVGSDDIPDGTGGVRKVAAGDVAMLLSKMTNVGCYTAALDAEGLPYVVEGEKSFYTTQEITDLLNLLAALSDPHNRTALVGVLRSGAGAMTDTDIARLAEAGRLDYTWEGPLPDELDDREGAEGVFRIMRELHAGIARLPVTEAIDAVTDRLPVVEAAVASGSGERGRANLRKIRRMAIEYGARPEMTMREFVVMLQGRVEDLQEEGESPLAEEDADAVRILTIHKAKGLEFPVVVMPGLHAASGGTESRIWVRSEWSSGEVGLRIGDAWTPSAVRLAAREKELDAAEGRRVFYVGATRARERLVFSAARIGRKMRGAPLSCLTEAVALPLDSEEPAVVACGAGAIHFSPLDAPEPAGGRAAAAKREKLPAEQVEAWAGRWAKRGERFEEAKARRVLVSPSSFAAGEGAAARAAACETHEATGAPEGGGSRPGRNRAAVVGTAVHAVLERLAWASGDPRSALDGLIGREMELLPAELKGSGGEIADELAAVLARFVDSDVFADLRRARVLARELACILPWEVDSLEAAGECRAAAEGVIDLVCELDGRLLVADYKTDRVEGSRAREHAERYRTQGEMYARAVTLATGRRVDGFRVIFVRPCVAVEIDVPAPA
jgi:ATP-dependent helicase/nuclease subunit A